MAFSIPGRLLQIIPTFLLLRTVTALGLTLTYCSDQNLGSQITPETSIFQSLGNCQSQCKSSYAFAVVQGENCWCSNYVPGDQFPIANCETPCPGYPYEYCGSTDSNLFGYLALNLLPSGTIAGSAATTNPSKITTPVTTQSLQTIGGSVLTRTVTLMPSTGTGVSDQTVQKSKMSSGSIIAIAVAVVIAGVVLLAVLILAFCCYRRKSDRSYDDIEPTNNLGRNTSVLSKSGLLGAASSPQQSESPERPLPAMSERRGSRLQVYDQRLNPEAFMKHSDASRSSFVSMQDNRDYTRTLNIRNPDPTD